MGRKNRHYRSRLEYEGMDLKKDWMKLKEKEEPAKISKKRQMAESCHKIDFMIKDKVEKDNKNLINSLPENAEIIDMSVKVPVLDECMYEKCEL